jgi:DNA-binding response OmpR family regulator
MTEKKTVLIIDDDKAISGFLHEMLQSDGFEVSCCDDGMSALGLAKEKCFDVVITDYRMPGMDGVEITRSLRLQCSGSFIIGISSECKGKNFFDAGADAFLKKPFPFKDLISIIIKKPPV